MKTFYRINKNGDLEKGSGFLVPNGFIEYTKDKEPKELLDAIINERYKVVKASKINKINTTCEKEITSNFSSDALGDAHIYQSEQTDQLNLIEAVTAGTDDYFKCGVADANGNVTWNYELHTIAQLQQVLADGKAHKQGLLQKANTLKPQVAHATTVRDVEAIVW